MCLMTVRGVRTSLRPVAPVPVCRYQELRFSGYPSNADGHRDAEANGRDRAGGERGPFAAFLWIRHFRFRRKIYLGICDSTVLTDLCAPR